MIDPEIGFTSDVIKDPERFVCSTNLVRDCIQSINSPLGLVAVFGKRGVGKSSLVRQIQQMALGDYSLASRAGLETEIPARPRTYLTVYYQCDSTVRNAEHLLQRLCNDQDSEDGLLRLVPDDGKEIVEFARTKEVGVGADLKVINWGAKGIESSKFAKVVEGDLVQTFRNYISAIVTHQVKGKMKRDGLLILLDEFDVIQDKSNLGSVIKSLSSANVKFGICGIGQDISDLVEDHGSVERLLEHGAIHISPMPEYESQEILDRAERLFKGAIVIDQSVKTKIVNASEGYPYFVQLMGKECVSKANERSLVRIDDEIYNEVLEDIKAGRALPTLESQYRRAIGDSESRQMLLHLLAEQEDESQVTFEGEAGRILLKDVRGVADDFDVQHLDQVLPRLVDVKFGPVLKRSTEKSGVYEFTNPVFRLYVRLRRF